MENSVDPDQMASEEAIWSGSTLFSKAMPILVQQDKGWILKTLFAKFKLFFSSFSTPCVPLIRKPPLDSPKGGLSIRILLYMFEPLPKQLKF